MSCIYNCRISDEGVHIHPNHDEPLQSIKIYDGDEPIQNWLGKQFVCNLPVVNGFSKCIYHKCTVLDCDIARSRCSKFCDKHSCEYYDVNHNKCSELVYANGLCDKHKCKECNAPILHSNVQYCRKHLKEMICSITGCKNTFPIDANMKTTCSEHSCVKCGLDVRLNAVKYCWTCSRKFKYDDGNEDLRNAYDAYECDRLCCVEWCTNLKFGNKHCAKHQCKYPNCEQVRLDEDIEMGDYVFKSRYCLHHHLLDRVCTENYGFELKILPLLDHIVLDEHDKQNEKNKFILYVKQLADMST